MHIAGDERVIPDYVSRDQVRHEPAVRDGLSAFLADLKVVTLHRTIDEITLLLGQHDFVFSLEGNARGSALCLHGSLPRREWETRQALGLPGRHSASIGMEKWQRHPLIERSTSIANGR